MNAYEIEYPDNNRKWWRVKVSASSPQAAIGKALKWEKNLPEKFMVHIHLVAKNKTWADLEQKDTSQAV